MGGFSFIIYNNTSVNIEFIKKFMEIKHRGVDDTLHISESSIDLTTLNTQQQLQISLDLSKDEIRSYKKYSFEIAFHRMCVNDKSFNGSQPFDDPILNKLKKYPDLRNRPNRKLICNGEIYNYSEIIHSNNFIDKDIQSNSDVEVILPLYIKYNDIDSTNAIINTINDLDGEFAFVLTENLKTYITSSINIYVVRDYLGFKPIFYVKSNTNNSDFYMFVSEIKALPAFVINNDSYSISQVKPGTFWSFKNKDLDNPFTEYYNINTKSSLSYCTICNRDSDTMDSIFNNIKNLLVDSIISRSHNVKDIGILLSDGFDSSLLTSILVKYYFETNNLNKIHLFTIGDTENTDIVNTIKFVEFLKEKYPNVFIIHHIIYIDDIDILTQDIEKIIYHLETFEPETIRDSIPYYYLFKYISEKTNVKIFLTGDGLDELCGYPNFNNLNDTQFQNKSVELLKNLCHYDLLRTDRIGYAFSLELRHPFLTRTFVEYFLSIHPKIKRSQIYKNNEEPIEKYIIRKTFQTSVQNYIYLPENVLWRRMKCICESLTNFESRLFNYFENSMTDEIFNVQLQKLINYNVNHITLPKNKEEMQYRLIFDKLYPNRSYLVKQFWDNIWV
jgi:asparagine synthase (glutamine-hydrolysing)